MEAVFFTGSKAMFATTDRINCCMDVNVKISFF